MEAVALCRVLEGGTCWLVVAKPRSSLAGDADRNRDPRLYLLGESHHPEQGLTTGGHWPHQSTRQAREEPSASSLGKIKFNPTVRHIVINEHKDVTFNCSIKVPQLLLRPDTPGISLWKDGRELDMQDRIATSHFEISDEEEVSMTSTFSILAAQRSDNGSYVCKLNISGMEVVSDPILVQLEGLSETALFSCEAHNSKGLTASSPGQVNVKGHYLGFSRTEPQEMPGGSQMYHVYA
ncbi:tyrosine-protein kinase mer [Limosa lapponica baueri]|uniref:Tyrosine-protein kinase mer n=1 Tax=Limosa lapponica baueri TaxID=1758121 RepID=A0A2I0T2L3_LIMLA|nr:tyrosine-protein kinase mer [Limosa lapponica baueri]